MGMPQKFPLNARMAALEGKGLIGGEPCDRTTKLLVI
jgi:hypothetical protein